MATFRPPPIDYEQSPGTDRAGFVPNVAKQHDKFVGAISFGVQVSARALVFDVTNNLETCQVSSTKISQNQNGFPLMISCLWIISL